ncbi:Putative type II secretion system protein D precursor [Rubripirellula lacrimiformis]|uniref:Type II secretion system protein D n=1 Tax=Rubripirellula lacrimiformis TaxID=1930273 RepID=A0A517NJX2_9BACT|nr:secretin N-terminal domain-containing protein [Rubripirellula lacrimiformis]QDT07431.1 Putative type II secretion system protein D precursor [Rubripirellula lacrimiformis]
MISFPNQQEHRNAWSGILFLTALLVLVLSFSDQAVGQEAVLPATRPAAEAPMLRLSTQGEVPLTDFVDYVSQRLGIQILYDNSLRQKKVNLIAPDPIPVGSLSEILQSILINEGLVVTDANQQGFRRITTNDQIPRVARPSEGNEDLSGVDAAVPLTRVFVLTKSLPSAAAELITPFLTPQGASAIPLDRSRLLIVTDVAQNIRRAEQLMKIVDGDEAQVEVEFIQAKYVAPAELMEQLREILSAKQRAMGRGEEDLGGVEISVDSRTSSLILIGTKRDLDVAKALLERLDQGLKTDQQTFTLRYFSPARLDEIVREVLQGRPIKPPYQSRVEGNLLIVNSTEEVLLLVDRTQRQVDTREAPEGQSPVRFYKIKNVPAQELVETIRGVGANVTSISRRNTLPERRRTTNDLAVPGPNQLPRLAQPMQGLPTPPAMRDQRAAGLNDPLAMALPEDIAGIFDEGGFNRGFPEDLIDDSNGSESQADSLIGEATVTVDVHTNTIIVVAPPEVQRIYADLISRLDQRRPQVLVEAQVVIIDTSDDYSLGVEISGGDRTGAKRLFSFSSYGLSTVDPTSGALSILPGVGFNGTLVDPSTADVVVRALTNHRRARVLSTPRILVNDNAEGQLTSVLEVPFTSVNASQTVATTSFAGFAEAGTTITVTPTISEDNYLNLDYVVTLNSFTGTGSDGVPPPRQTNEVRSRVTVPDGYTVIVGGLTSKNESYEIDSIPFLELIPIIKDLASLQTDSWSQTSLFVFLKPVILREDKFKDLRFLSDVNLRKSGQATNFPENIPLTIE